jgi:hypothetical protein
MDLATVTGQREGELLKRPALDPHAYTDDSVGFYPAKDSSPTREVCESRVMVSSGMLICSAVELNHRHADFQPQLQNTLNT